MPDNARIDVVAAKTPLAGRVKTRLCPPLRAAVRAISRDVVPA